MFVSKKSKYQKLFKALRDNQLGEREGVEKPWFYPDRLLYLDLIGVTGGDIVKRESMWFQAGFEPTMDVVRLEGHNKFLFTAAPKKPSTSTMIYDRYAEWTAQITDKLRLYNWFLGEYVNRNEFKFKDCYSDFSIAFIGQSGSGKTEAMKMWLTAFFCMHPATRLVLCDLKMTGDWDVFGPLCENGTIVKSVESTLLAILYFDDLLAYRTKHMQEKGYKNIKAWSEAEGIEVPPVLLIIDEFPQMNGPLKFDIQSRRDGTPANALFKLMTKGRSFGLWVIVGSQFSGSDAIPSEMNKNIKVHVTLRTGSEGESMQWINSPVAFRLGKGKRRPDGTEDGQQGYAYIDAEEEFVRFWYMDDWYIVHELMKYGVLPMEGLQHIAARVPSTPMDIANTIKALKSIGKSEKNLTDFNRSRLANHEKAVATFKESFELVKTSFAKELEEIKGDPELEKKKVKRPLGTLWKEGETIEEYVARARSLMGMAAPTATGGSLAGGVGGGGRPSIGAAGGGAGPGAGFITGGSRQSPLSPQPAARQPAGGKEPQSMDEFLAQLQGGSPASTRGASSFSPQSATPPSQRIAPKPPVLDEDADLEYQKLLDERQRLRRELREKAEKAKASAPAKMRRSSAKGDQPAKSKGAGTKESAKRKKREEESELPAMPRPTPKRTLTMEDDDEQEDDF